MADNDTGTGTGAQGGGNGGDGQEPPAGGGPGTGAQGDQGNGNGSGDQIDVESIADPALKAYVLKVQKGAEDARREAAERRTTMANLQTQFDQFRSQHETAEQAAQRAETERQAQAATERERLTALERENRDLKVGGVLRDAAVTAKAINPDTVMRMLKDQVTLDDQGKPNNLQALITDLKSTDPYLFRRASRDAGGGQGQGEGSASEATDMNDRIRSALRGGSA